MDLFAEIEWWTVIQVIITMIGFVVSYYLQKNNFKQELSKTKTNLAIEKTQGLPEQIINLIDEIIVGKDIKEEFDQILKNIQSYGSEKVINIVAKMQQDTYTGINTEEKHRLMAYLILLLCQLKYDLIGATVSPESWYEIKLRDYKKTKCKLREVNNTLVDELKLDKFLLIR